MALIKSISGIRGTIGGVPSENLTPEDIVKYTTAYVVWLKQKNSSHEQRLKVVIGRDSRLSGQMLNQLVSGSLLAMGVDVVDLGLSTTPTVEIAVTKELADGGIILTASHNPINWNALKLLNERGEFISAKEGAQLLEIAEKESFTYAEVTELGTYSTKDNYVESHVDAIINLPLVNVDAIRNSDFKVVVDGVNSTGGIFVPELLKALGVKEIIKIHCEPNGLFPHNPEPLPENLADISNKVRETKADVGIVVDPDVDRLALVCENGEMFGEEYTLVAVADYILKHKKGNTVSNLSSTRALRDVTEKHGCSHFSSAVGEVNVVEQMKKSDAVIGGEGNGGIIYPASHYGRDALVGIALFLSHLATFEENKPTTCSKLKASFNSYHISKNKIELTPEIDVDQILQKIQEKFKDQPINTIDGVKIEFDREWVHLRKSNTEPIIRIYAESETLEKASLLADKIISNIRAIIES